MTKCMRYILFTKIKVYMLLCILPIGYICRNTNKREKVRNQPPSKFIKSCRRKTHQARTGKLQGAENMRNINPQKRPVYKRNLNPKK
ncbi:transmembrane protein, putative [Medicago truncatula]|uniref:Transmembrane protein, putative n=1 Tax=Medicago truncatula TaxID=3880 RepID=G7IE23_MEDTR|nr:transmembrane protein, putative [Medicago truncatula]